MYKFRFTVCGFDTHILQISKVFNTVLRNRKLFDFSLYFIYLFLMSLFFFRGVISGSETDQVKYIARLLLLG